ncbi:class II glutamine amidotransferase [Methylobacterium oxalidis]|uniref:Glutamine amidotransferase n=1 Tax=Methylobacterium oxalidis TaxID=944322 RepID=A0A512J5W9_9HYPH|nr:glutamine amidotransferase family protein [Methylobacterium oxalidis]GEP05371.1 glutamine amidotransferase [Methylobacterium oxalidis]GJE31380.1 Amidophosphoribosyltransferase [Methylobacterium oxalidis]GLS63491.1 glutamine amidotransferase [Methylobacterium oxalidis]
MCGIVGLFLKKPELEPQLGTLLAKMLETMTDRGPDSAGFAVYGSDAAGVKLTLRGPDRASLADAAARLEGALGEGVERVERDTHTVLSVPAAREDEVRTWLKANAPGIDVVSAGRRMEIYKEVGLPASVAERFDLSGMSGSHGIGHTRMATESAVTTNGAHPFSTGTDECLVHNGSLSNHNDLRRRLEREGLSFATKNDTEVAAGYLSWRMREGASLKEALESSLTDLDGFFTFVVGTETGFAVVRDPIACKPAVMAETDDYVAFGSEYRALVGLPGIDKARVFEPEPAKVYAWERH